MTTVGMVAMSLDGCITRHAGEGTAFASREDQIHFRRALAEFDCSVMGSGSFEAHRTAILAALGPQRLRIVLTGSQAKYADLRQTGRLEFRQAAPAGILEELAALGRTRCAVLGGARVYTDFIRAGLMDELWVTLEPLAFGAGRRLFEGEIDFGFTLLGCAALSADTLLLKYRPRAAEPGPLRPAPA
jgi:dihydrofolate reductase